MSLSPTAIRNIAIVAAIALVIAVWQGGAIIAGGISQIIWILFLFAIVVFVINYFRQRQLAWLVLTDLQKKLIIGAGVGVVILVLGFPFLASVITPLGVVALIALLAVLVIWVIRESQRLR